MSVYRCISGSASKTSIICLWYVSLMLRISVPLCQAEVNHEDHAMLGGTKANAKVVWLYISVDVVFGVK